MLHGPKNRMKIFHLEMSINMCIIVIDAICLG